MSSGPAVLKATARQRPVTDQEELALGLERPEPARGVRCPYRSERRGLYVPCSVSTLTVHPHTEMSVSARPTYWYDI
ncbi:MAG: hypothetical protein ACM3ML_16935 [Micromonosporaceae bacterium]